MCKGPGVRTGLVCLGSCQKVVMAGEGVGERIRGYGQGGGRREDQSRKSGARIMEGHVGHGATGILSQV